MFRHEAGLRRLASAFRGSDPPVECARHLCILPSPVCLATLVDAMFERQVSMNRPALFLSPQSQGQ